MKLAKGNIWLLMTPILIITLGFSNLSIKPALLFALALLFTFRLIFYSFNGKPVDNSKFDNSKLRITFIIINLVFTIYYVATNLAPFMNQLDAKYFDGLPYIAICILFAITSVPSMHLILNKEK